jgi:hypothetical protein
LRCLVSVGWLDCELVGSEPAAAIGTDGSFVLGLFVGLSVGWFVGQWVGGLCL